MTSGEGLKAQEREEFRRHWPLVMAAASGFFFSSIVSNSTGLFMEPLGNEFGWSRTLQSSGTAITASLTFFLSPIFGILIDRWGTRRMALVGTVGASVIMSCFSMANGSALQWIMLWTIYAFAAVMIKSTIWVAAVSSVFSAGRGLALGLTLSGAAVAQAVIPPAANALIDAFGWRGAWIGLGLGFGSAAFLMSLFWLHDGYDIARRERQEQAPKEGALLDAPGLTVSQALRDRALIQIAIATFIMMTVTVGLTVHQFEILRSIGVGRTEAAFLTSITGVAGVLGKLVTGWLLDRYTAKWVGSLTLGITVFAFGMLLLPNLSVALIAAAMFINGYSAGTKLQLSSYLTSAYGGMRHFGAIFGIIASLIAAGSGFGPILGGLIFDRYGDYDPFLMLGIAVSLAGALLVFFLPAYPAWVSRRRSQPAAADL